jgi:predicted membrane channel-forming protein YqfA (hemolysin III family)
LKHEDTLHLIGWTLFIICAMFYIIASLEAGSMTAIIGSVLFFVGCCVFMIPVLYRWCNRN